MIGLQGKLRIGAWVQAWYLNRSLLMSSVPTPTNVLPVIAAPWKRSQRTDWVWRLRNQEYSDTCFGGTLDTSMGEIWGRCLFPDEVTAWEYAVRWYEGQLAKRRVDLEQEIRRREAEIEDARGMLAMARFRSQDA